MVVDDVLDHCQTGLVTRVDELHVGKRAAVVLMNGVPEHPVVAPVVRAVEGVYRHEFHEVDAKLDEVVEPLDRRCQGSFWSEGPDMQLVDNAAGKLATGPLLVRPEVLAGIEGSRPAVDPARLSSGARIG